MYANFSLFFYALDLRKYSGDFFLGGFFSWGIKNSRDRREHRIEEKIKELRSEGMKEIRKPRTHGCAGSGLPEVAISYAGAPDRTPDRSSVGALWSMN